MNMTIKLLEITAFKGIQHLLLELGGKSAVLSGRNGTGKTSVDDAFLWLLFGKDSAGKKPDVKPRDGGGGRVSGLESDVRAILTVDGVDVELRRQWHEVWQKGADGEKVYSRDETLCWINGTPSKLEKEYTPYVLGMVGGDENTFKLLTDLGAFMRLDWSDRRRELVKIAGGDPDGELRQREEFKDVDRILNGGSPEDAKKRLLEQRRRLDDELKAIPTRIDELEKTLQPVDDQTLALAQDELARLTVEQRGVEEQMEVSPEMLKRQSELFAQRRENEAKLADLSRAAKEPIAKELAEAEDQRMSLRRAAANAEADRLIKEDAVRQLEAILEAYKQKRESRLAEWHSFEAMTYTPPEEQTTCPTCGQQLPEERVLATAQRHRDEWAAKKNASMETIKADGKSIADKIAECGVKLDAARAELAIAEEVARSWPDGNVALEAKINGLRERLSTADEEAARSPEALALLDRNAAIVEELEALGKDDRRDALKLRLEGIRQEMSRHQALLVMRDQSERVKARISELGEEKRKVGAQAAQVERDISLLADYVRARCGALEDAINSLFHTIRWKLFEEAKNGSLLDRCDATVNGIAYAPAELNTGACVNADIEIINVLSRAYGVAVPCFVDNAERVNQIGFPGGQRILLRVTEEPKLTLTREEE